VSADGDAALPTVTVVVSSFNGAAHLPATLESLKAQDYPAGKLSLIVVDDGSADDTAAVAERCGARVVRHDVNRGLSAARNSGLAACASEVYAGFDDDCLAEPSWLRELMGPYADPEVMGVGGTILDTSAETMVSRYLQAVGYGAPSPVEFGASPNPAVRFATYVRAMFAGRERDATHPPVFRVHEIMGGNSSFRVAALRAVEGWDEELSGAEDVDLCARLRRAFPDRQFAFAERAAITHEHGMTLRGLVSRPYRRGPVTYRYYRRNGMVPPLFPLPGLALLLALGALLLRPRPKTAVLAAALAPQAAYPWWVTHVARGRGSARRLAFPYIQLLFEGATIAGLVRGFLRSR
jgi:glycosyltransferase involved in cell wall biosynthesis